jgi:NTP pyrophosphatase (non-canonical NTP hydrolase)
MDKRISTIRQVLNPWLPYRPCALIEYEEGDYGIDWDDYARLATVFSVYPKDFVCIAAMTGVIAEIGEVTSLVNKRLRGDDNPNFQELLEKELGDVCWFIALGMECEKEIGGIVFEDLEIVPETFGLLHPSGNFYELKLYVEWYCFAYHLNFERILYKNLEKLMNRWERNVIRGDGDAR